MTKCFCATCIDQQCRLTKCTACKTRIRMLDLIKFEANYLLYYTNGGVSTTANEPSSGNRLRIHVEDTSEYALTPKTTGRGYTLIRLTRANWMSVEVNWTNYIDLAELDHPQARTERVACH